MRCDDAPYLEPVCDGSANKLTLAFYGDWPANIERNGIAVLAGTAENSEN